MKQQPTHAMAGWKTTLALLCCAGLTQHAQAQTQAAQPAQARQAAAKEQGAATQQQTRKTDQANRAAAVADETSAAAAQAARTAQSEAAQYEAAQRGKDAGSGAATPPSYGPVLAPRVQQPADPVRKDPAEVHDETDTRTRQAPPQEPQASQQARQPAQPRRPAAQAMTEPMAPRPLRSSVDASGATAGASASASTAVPVPPPATPPRPVTPSSRVIGSCQGASCLDTNGNRYNGIGDGNAGVNSSGRLCTRTGVTVQCF